MLPEPAIPSAMTPENVVKCTSVGLGPLLTVRALTPGAGSLNKIVEFGWVLPLVTDAVPPLRTSIELEAPSVNVPSTAAAESVTRYKAAEPVAAPIVVLALPVVPPLMLNAAPLCTVSKLRLLDPPVCTNAPPEFTFIEPNSVPSDSR